MTDCKNFDCQAAKQRLADLKTQIQAAKQQQSGLEKEALTLQIMIDQCCENQQPKPEYKP